MRTNTRTSRIFPRNATNLHSIGLATRVNIALQVLNRRCLNIEKHRTRKYAVAIFPRHVGVFSSREISG
jgi:hypothetical protein